MVELWDMVEFPRFSRIVKRWLLRAFLDPNLSWFSRFATDSAAESEYFDLLNLSPHLDLGSTTCGAETVDLLFSVSKNVCKS